MSSEYITASGLATWTGGTMTDAGTTQANGGMTLSGTTKSLNGARTLNNAGTAQWTAGNFNSGGGAIFNNQATGTFDTNFDGIISQNQGGALTQFNNAGTFTKSAGVSTEATTFTIGFTNTGTVNANAGRLAFNGPYTQTAGATVLNGGAISTNGTLTIVGGRLSGTGTITGNVSNGGTLDPGFSAGTIGVTGNLSLTSTSHYDLEIGGPNQGSDYDFLSEAGTVQLTLAGTITPTLLNGYSPGTSDVFTVLTSNQPLLGSFSNAANNDRLITADGLNTFRINYGASSPFDPNSVVLSDFALIPEPSSLLLAALGVGFLSLRRQSNRPL
jgi:hypothetical protein